AFFHIEAVSTNSKTFSQIQNCGIAEVRRLVQCVEEGKGGAIEALVKQLARRSVLQKDSSRGRMRRHIKLLGQLRGLSGQSGCLNKGMMVQKESNAVRKYSNANRGCVSDIATGRLKNNLCLP